MSYSIINNLFQVSSRWSFGSFFSASKENCISKFHAISRFYERPLSVGIFGALDAVICCQKFDLIVCATNVSAPNFSEQLCFCIFIKEFVLRLSCLPESSLNGFISSETNDPLYWGQKLRLHIKSVPSKLFEHCVPPTFCHPSRVAATPPWRQIVCRPDDPEVSESDKEKGGRYLKSPLLINANRATFTCVCTGLPQRSRGWLFWSRNTVFHGFFYIVTKLNLLISRGENFPSSSPSIAKKTKQASARKLWMGYC